MSLIKDYVVSIGDVGSGKSTICEKLSGESGRSSAAAESVTRVTEVFNSRFGSLVIADTPGTNAVTDKLQHNVQVAIALNMAPVSRILIIVKADTRMDNVVDNARKFAEQLADLDPDMLAVVVTHMDTVTWTRDKLVSMMDGDLGIKDIIFSGRDTVGQTLHNDIKALCLKKFPLCINGDNFFRLFKVHNNNLRIIRSCKRQVDLFKAIIKFFYEQRKQFDADTQADLTFEFQAFMQEMITEAQKEMAAENNFEFIGDNATMEAGHIANMSNQLRALLYDIRVETLAFAAKDLGDQDMRKCPHCGEVWTKVEGCNGSTTCGKRTYLREHRSGVMSTFTFQIMKSRDVLQNFIITKSSTKTIGQRAGASNGQAGCGRTIDWATMKPVPVPAEFRENPKINTDDVGVLPIGAAGGVAAAVGQMIISGGRRLIGRKNRNRN